MVQVAKKIRNVRRKDERPGEILEAALDVFAINGYAGARLDDVAERAGISKGTIYLYFKSKEELFHEVVRHWILPQLEKVEEIGSQKKISATEILRQQLQVIYADLVATDASVIPKLIISEGARFPELAQFYHQEIITRCHQNLRGVLERGVAEGEFRPAVLNWELQAIFSPALTAAIWRSVFEQFSPLDLQAYLKTHIDLLLNGLRKAT